ncbi:AEC family transporter [Geomicrobium sediminis]|uniref:Permease n=1 Tax=Geomicrobium sediminis TaxID=1347788 RepID=A0ABS2PEX3_9BACL|nr:AEC family transporter [Geomicrobium sediminis]MBM7633979.1 putative permease [Geomicrobium sediminis]
MFFSIMTSVILPILLLVLIGAFLQKKFSMNLSHLSKLLTYCLMPAAVFLNLYLVELDAQLLTQMIVYLLLFSLVTVILSQLLSKLLHLKAGEKAALNNSITLMNSGNYGLPVSQLVFSGQPIGITVQIFVLVFQNIMTYSYGLYNLLAASKSLLEILKAFIRMPVIYAVLLGLFLQYLNVTLPDFLMVPIEHLANGFVALALLLLGAQLSAISIRYFHRVITWALLGRLIAGPVIAFLLISILGIGGVIAQSLFIASSFPTSRNTSSLALEYNVEPELHAQIVLYSTLLSILTVTFTIYLSTILF